VTGPTAAVASDYGLLRGAVAALPMARDALAVTGPDAEEYLQGQCSQDIAALGDGECADALLLTPQGKLEALVRVTRAGAERFVVDVDGGFGELVAARLLRFRLRVKVDIEPLPWTGVALRGPEAVVPATLGNGVELALPWSWGELRGVDLLGPAPAAPDGMPSCHRAAWESVRVEAGIPVMGAELDERTIAAEAGLLERTVSFTKGCYTGQELVARLDARGNKVARRLAGLVATVGSDAARPVDGPPEEAGAAAVLPPRGSALTSGGPDDADVGVVTSSTWSYGLGTVAALAYVHRKVELPASLGVVLPEGDPIAVEARVLPLFPLD
jgi:folate-binding protein YgfZ